MNRKLFALAVVKPCGLIPCADFGSGVAELPPFNLYRFAYLAAYTHPIHLLISNGIRSAHNKRMPNPGKQSEIDKAISHLMDWSDTSEWEDMKSDVFNGHLLEVADRLNMDIADLSDLLVEYDLAGMAFGFCFEDLASLRFPPDNRNLVEDFLKCRGWREGVRGRRYLRQLSNSVLSLYEVVNLVPGSHCDVRDLLQGGQPVRVYEQSGTRSMAQWDHIAARVLPGDGKRIFSGAILPFSPEASEVLLKALDDVRKRGKKKFAGLAKSKDFADVTGSFDPGSVELPASAFSQVWLMYVVERLTAPPPEFVTTDGEPLLLAETRMTFERSSRQRIITLLDKSEDWEREIADELSWVWLPEGDDENGFPTTLHAFLRMTEDDLWLTANSQNRSEKGIEALVDVLGDLVNQQLTRLQSPQQYMEEERMMLDSSPGIDPAGTGLNPNELSDLMSNYLDQHYRQALDEPIPALDNKTPRQCIRTKNGKIKVIAWLKYLENQEYRRASQSAGTLYDFSWMWNALGLDKSVEK